MPRVPDELVLWRIEYVVKSDGKFDCPEPGTEVSTGLRDAVNKEFPHLGADLPQILQFKPAQIFRVIY